MKATKRALALLLASGMVTAMLAGCQSNPSATTSSTGTSSATGTASTGDGDRAMEGNMYLEGLPLVKEKESFSVLIDDSNDSTTVKDWPLLKLLAEETNVDVDWQIFPYDVAVEKKNLLLNSGDYPDAMGGWLIGATDIVKYGTKEGVFIPIEEAVDKYAPNIKATLDLTNVRRDMTLPDGHIYSPPYPIPEPECFFAPWINQVWLDKLGLKMPTTTEELKEVLIAFKTKDPNGNGRADEIALTSRADHFYFWTAMFGYPTPDATLTMVDDKPTYTGTMDFVKDAYIYFADLYKAGLIDPELFTQDITTYNNRGKGEDATYGVAIMYNPADIAPGLDEAELRIRGNDYVPLPPLKSSTTDKPMWARGSSGLTLFRTQLVITDNAKNPNTIIRWLDNLYSEKNSVQAAMGVFGITSEKNADGVYEQLPKTDVTGAPGYAEWIGSMPKYVPEAIWDSFVRAPSEIQMNKTNDEMDAIWANNMVEITPPTWMSAEESAEISTIQTDIANYVKQKRAEWVTGVSDVSKDWDAYKAQMEKLGLPKLIEVNTAGINRTLGK